MARELMLTLDRRAPRRLQRAAVPTTVTGAPWSWSRSGTVDVGVLPARLGQIRRPAGQRERQDSGTGHLGGRWAVSDPRLSEWIVLRRVHDGGVAKVAGVYLDHGRPVPGHLTEVFDRLTWNGLLVVAEGEPIGELRRLSLTDTGQARYTALCAERQQQRAAHEAPAPEFGTPPPDPGGCCG